MELNKIYCWDCFEIMQQIPDGSIDLILTDPPYKLHAGRAERKYQSEWMATIKSNMETDIYTKEFFETLLKKTKKPNMVFFCNKMQIPDILDRARENDLNFDILVLCKTAPAPLTQWQWLPDREYAIHLRKWIPIRWNYQTKHWFRIAPNFKDTKVKHPTVKPLNVIKDIIMNLTDKWDVVLDPFIGSGTTAIACTQLERNYIWCEISEEYCKLANSRLEPLSHIQ